MSITPFLPGLPVPATSRAGSAGQAASTDGGVGSETGGTPSGTPGGEWGAGFGDALLAALAGGQSVTTAPLPQPVELGVAPVELGSAPVESGVATVDLAVATMADGDAASRATTDLLVATVPGAVGSSVPPAPGRRTTEGAALAGASTISTTQTSLLDAAGSTPQGPQPGTSLEADLASSGAPGANANSTGANANSTGTNPISAVTNPNSAVTNPDSTVGRAVVQQVFPEVTRMVSTAGNGTHRITLTLQPEQLGEVRATLVVRDGSVQVRLAGGPGGTAGESAALHRALAGGAPELQRLLERTGAEARVSVRDPFASVLPPAPQAAPAGPTAQGQTGQAGAQDPHPGPDAQARSDAQARRDGQPAREQPHQQTQQQTRHHEERRASYGVEPVTPRTETAGRLDRTV